MLRWIICKKKKKKNWKIINERNFKEARFGETGIKNVEEKKVERNVLGINYKWREIKF